MIRTMEIRTVVLFVVAMATVVYAQNTTSEPLSNMFGNLPQANYTADQVATVDTGSLQGVFDMAKGFVDVVFRPFSELTKFIEEIFAIVSNNSDEDIGTYLSENWKELAQFEAGYIACLVFGILFIVFVPLVGSIMCCCRCCCSNCGGHLEQSTERSKSCWRQCLCVTMLILTTLMAIPTVFVFLNNEWITQVVDTGPNQIVAVLNDTTKYLTVVPEQIKYVTDQYETVDDNVRPLVADFGQSVGVPFQQYVREESAGSMAALQNAETVQNDALSSIDTVDESLAALTTGMANLDASLAAVRTNLTTELAGSPCTGDSACVALRATTNKLDVGFDVTQITPLANDLDSVKTDLSSFNITEQNANLEKEIDDIPNTVKTQTQDASDSAVDALNTAQDAVNQVDSSLPTSSLDDVETTVSDLSDSITNAISVYDDNFDQYRYIAGLVLGSMLAFIVGCYFLGMLLGVCGNDRKVSPAERGCSSNCGGIWLMVGVGFSFIFSWLLMILVVVLFTIGGHGERYGCQGLEEPDYEAFALIQNVTNLNLSATFDLPDDVELTVADILNSCKNDVSIYEALKLAYVYNITEFLNNVTSQMADLETELDDAVNDLDFSEIEIYSAESQQQLLALKSSGIDSINFTSYLEDLGDGVTATNLTEYAETLRAAAGNFTTASSLAPVVNAQADELDRIQAEEVEPLNQYYDDLVASIDELIKVSSQLNDTIDQLDGNLTAFNNSIQNGGKAEVQTITDAIYAQVSGNITDYTTWAGDQVINEVGACRPIYSAYTTTVGVFCDYLIDTINALWFSLGWCLFFLLPAAIVAMKLMKFFRRMSFADSYEEEPERLPPMVYLPGLASHRADNIRTWDEMEMRDYGAPGNKPNGAYY